MTSFALLDQDAQDGPVKLLPTNKEISDRGGSHRLYIFAQAV